ncbi:ScpA family protein [Acidobacterium sp. S8]|uniref:segregation and condensation protein A n=1 Tax=Acidobacterium sp. S8 TaxID=1641854 RepID=UPI00131DA0E5|nr:segregation/condensation protein A [Acidobacterium sp. S8]
MMDELKPEDASPELQPESDPGLKPSDAETVFPGLKPGASTETPTAEPSTQTPTTPASTQNTDPQGKSKDRETSKKEKPKEESASPFSITVAKVYDGPLDLLLDLIRKQDIDIYDIPIAKITAQFLAYVEQLKASDVDTAGEFIYTASLLIHIKSKMLLPRSPIEVAEGEIDDPRRELVERLLEHERFKNAAQMLAQKQLIEESTWSNPSLKEFRNDEGTEQEIAADTVDLVRVFREILDRLKQRPVLDLEEDSVTVGQMIDYMRRRLITEDKPVALRKLLGNARSEKTLVAMFLAVLELVRLQAILLRQDRVFDDIFVKKHADFEAVITERMNQMRDDWT